MAIYDVYGNVIAAGGEADVNLAKWRGKKIIVDGSSITSGGAGGKSPAWPTWLANELGVTIYDHSLSGSQWLWTYAYASSYSRLGDYEADADAIILMGDFSSSYTSLGAIGDAANVTGETYYARLKGYAEALISAFPLIPIIWAVEPPRNWNEHNVPTARQEVIASAIKSVAELYGFPTADCLHNTIYRPYNETNYAANTTDGTHPLNNIQRGMAQILIETLRKTPVVYPLS